MAKRLLFYQKGGIMGCFCHRSLIPLKESLERFSAVGPHIGDKPIEPHRVGLPGENIVQALDRWLAAHGLPAKPWQPEPHWINLQLPKTSANLDVHGITTISTFAQLHQSVLEKFGIDLLKPDQVNAFVRVVTTMNERLKSLEAARLATRSDALDENLQG